MYLPPASVFDGPVGYTVAFVVIILLLQQKFGRRKRHPAGLPLPPGPPKLPILGNLLQLSGPGPIWVTYAKLAKQYGNILHLSLPGASVVILSSLEVARDLLEQRSAKYSDRLVPPAVALAKVDWNFSLLPYTPWWRVHRRTFHQLLNAKEIPQYHPIIKYHILNSLSYLLSNPDQLLDETRRMFGNVILHITYGTKDEEYMEELTIRAGKQMQGLAKALDPAQLLINVIPALRFVPSWFPGAGWKRQLEQLALSAQEMTTKPFEEARHRLKSGAQAPCLVSHLLDQLPSVDDPEYNRQELIAKNVATMAFIAGAESTIGTASCIILALAMYPQVQERAREEIKSVVGFERLPDFDDISQLPYLQAFIKEVVRMWPVTPVALPHASSEDDVYKGVFIPRGTVVIANTWAIYRDPNHYPEPEVFRPERFLKDGQIDPSVLDPETIIFGYGRRICPGQHLSQESLSLWAACLLSAFTVLPGYKNDSAPLHLRYRSTGSINSHPEHFQCHIAPRSHAFLLDGSQ